MKKQLSLALLTLNIFSLNVLPAKAEINSNEIANINNAFSQGQWCVEVPWMGFICWEL